MKTELLSQRLSLPYLQKNVEEVERAPTIPVELRPLIDNFYATAEEIVAKISQLPPYPEQQRTGGVLAISRQDENPFAEIREVGRVTAVNPDSEAELDRNKIDKYFVFAFAKMATVIGNGIFSSRSNILFPGNYQNKIGEAVVPAGAIRLMTDAFGPVVVSFSGYTMDDDEVVILAAAVKSDLIKRSTADSLASTLGNPRYEQIIDRLLV